MTATQYINKIVMGTKVKVVWPYFFLLNVKSYNIKGRNFIKYV